MQSTSVSACILSGTHLVHRNSDGYCDQCSFHEEAEEMPMDQQLAYERGANTSYDDKE